jgi:hypothetical protein
MALIIGALALLIIAYVNGIGLVRGNGDVMNHVYWATAAVAAVVFADFIALAHLARSERMVREMRALLEANGIQYRAAEA